MKETVWKIVNLTNVIFKPSKQSYSFRLTTMAQID
jgi:hypothetical protein